MSIDRLEPLIGDWTVHVDFADLAGTTSFEYALDGAYVLQRAHVEHPDAPDVLAVIAPDGDRFIQHYFDSRGVTRLYELNFDGGVLTLVREKPDFSELSFRQRYVGELSEDGSALAGEWQTGDVDGGDWKKDFGLTYRRA